MPTINWLKKEFRYGYCSGNVSSFIPNLKRLKEERQIGGSYRKVFFKAVLPFLNPNARVLELGPGRGSWSRSILKYIPRGELHVVDFQDVGQWLTPERYNGRLFCHKVTDNSFSVVDDGYFDFFFSFGVLCHNNVANISEILRNSLPKMKPNGVAVHQYGDWNKLEQYGWNQKSNIPISFKEKPDDEIWWPRNNQATMKRISLEAGWTVDSVDLNLIKRDSIISLRKPTS